MTMSDEAAALIREHGRGEFRVGAAAWFAMVQELYTSQPLLVRESSIPTIATFYGMPICPDPDLPAGVIELRNSMGETLGRIENVGYNVGPPPDAQHEPRRVRKVVIVYEGDEQTITHTRYVPDDEPPATGPTVRLAKKCRKCHDTLPVGATFCIECGEKT